MPTDPLASVAIITSLAALLYGLRVTHRAVLSETSLERTALVAGMNSASMALLVIMWL
jgi:hypothetical protein